MAEFKTGKRFGGGGGTGTYSRMVKKDSDFIYIKNRLSKGEEGEENPDTELRFIPAVEVSEDAEGNEQIDVNLPFNPKGTDKELWNHLGPAFVPVQMVNFYKNSTVNTILATMPDKDEDGKSTPNIPPWYYFLSRMNFKYKEVVKQISQGGAVEPAALDWADEKESTFPRPPKNNTDLWAFQALARSIDGEVQRDEEDGKTIVPAGPGLFVIPASAAGTFFEEMFNVDKDSRPKELSLETCSLGDFHSPDKGRMLRLSRHDPKGQTTRYSLRVTKVEWPLEPEQIARLYTPWEQILDMKTPKEQILEILEYYEPRMVAYAFKGSFLEKRAVEVGVDMTLAKDVLRAEVDLFKGERTQTEEELTKRLEEQGSTLLPDRKKTVRKTEDVKGKEEKEEKQDSASGVEYNSEGGGDKAAFKDAVNNMAKTGGVPEGEADGGEGEDDLPPAQPTEDDIPF